MTKETVSMAVQQNFRSALNGFNREDVVHYIEFINSKHQAELNQLHSELEFLRGKQEEPAPAQPQNTDLLENQAARIRELFDEKKELQEQLDAALEETQILENRLKAAAEEQTQLMEKLQAALQQNAIQSSREEELNAYRRAERTERLARERAERMYHQANGVLADATVRVEEAAGQIGDLTDRVMQQLGELRSAVAGSNQALKEAAASMATLRPEGSEE